jgi:hypothetical protein
MDNENNCLPDRLDTIEDKIDYVKACYSIHQKGENLFDWLVVEIKKSIVSEELKEIINKQVSFLEKNSFITNKAAADILEDLCAIKDILEI